MITLKFLECDCRYFSFALYINFGVGTCDNVEHSYVVNIFFLLFSQLKVKK